MAVPDVLRFTVTSSYVAIDNVAVKVVEASSDSSQPEAQATANVVVGAESLSARVIVRLCEPSCYLH